MPVGEDAGKSMVTSSDVNATVLGAGDDSAMMWNSQTGWNTVEGPLPHLLSETSYSMRTDGCNFVSALKGQWLCLWYFKELKWNSYTVMLPGVDSHIFFDAYKIGKEKNSRLVCQMKGAQPVIFDVVEPDNEVSA